MAFDITSTLRSIQSKLQADGAFRFVQIAEPKSPPGDDLTGAIFMDSARVVGTTLQDTIELHIVMVRLYMNFLREPLDQTELSLAQAASRIMEDLAEDYDLGGTIRNVDVGGQYGQTLGATFGYVEIASRFFRHVDIVVPLIVDGAASPTP